MLMLLHMPHITLPVLSGFTQKHLLQLMYVLDNRASLRAKHTSRQVVFRLLMYIKTYTMCYPTMLILPAP